MIRPAFQDIRSILPNASVGEIMHVKHGVTVLDLSLTFSHFDRACSESLPNVHGACFRFGPVRLPGLHYPWSVFPGS